MPDQGIAQLLGQRHSEWAALRAQWEFLQQSYEGGEAYLTANIFPHSPRETDADFRRRANKAVYPNYVRSVIRTYRNHVFKHPEGIARDVEDDEYRAWLPDVTRQGDSANTFWADVSDACLLYGMTYVLVDMPPALAGNDGLPYALSEADRRDTGLTPYLVHISPQNLVDWSLDERGHFRWIKVCEEYQDDAEPLVRRETRRRYRIWTVAEWLVVSEQGDVVARGAHPLGMVPLVPVRFERSLQWELSGRSFMYDFARMNRMVANSVSLRDRFLADSALQILAMQVGYSGAADDTPGPQLLKQGSVLEYPEGVQNAPAFIGPDASVVAHMQEHVRSLITEMYRLAMLADREGKVQGDPQSGAAKRMDFEETSAALAAFADALETAETKATSVWFGWLKREPPPDWRIDYPDRFNVAALSDDLLMALDVKALYGPLAPGFAAEYLRRLGTRLLEDLTPEQMAELDDDLRENLTNTSAEEVAAGRMAREQATVAMTRETMAREEVGHEPSA